MTELELTNTGDAISDAVYEPFYPYLDECDASDIDELDRYLDPIIEEQFEAAMAGDVYKPVIPAAPEDLMTVEEFDQDLVVLDALVELSVLRKTLRIRKQGDK